MQDLILKVENEKIGGLVATFLTTYKEQVGEFINQVLTAEGTPSEAGVEMKDGALKIYQFLPDKGYVLGEADGGYFPVELMKYSELPIGKKYILPQGDRLYLYFKEAHGVPDPKIGAFKTLNDIVTDFDSDSVKMAVKKFEEKKAADEKERIRTENRLRRLGKLPKDATQDQIDAALADDESMIKVTPIEGEVAPTMTVVE